MFDDINEALDQIDKDMAKDIPDSDPERPKKRKKTVAKVTKKKVVKKKAAASDKADTSNLVKLSKLANEAKMTNQGARKALRTAGLERSGRWAWEDGSKSLKDARKALGLS